MKIAIDTHSHTIASGHAYCTIREMAAAAAKKGLSGLAITEHAPTMPGTCHAFYFSNLKVLPRQMSGVEMLFGVELNILDSNGNIDLSEALLKEMDLVIASLHLPCFTKEADKEEYTNAYLNVMKNPYVDIIGHPDDGRIPVDYEKIVQAAAKYGKILEVNNSSLTPGGVRQNARENQHTILELCKIYKVPVTLSSDAHVDSDVGNVRYSLEVVRECGFPEELIVNTSVEKLKEYIGR